MKILVIDVGGTHVKVIASGRRARVKFASGPKMTPRQMVAGVLAATAGWQYDVVSIGYPGPVLHDQPMREPHNLGPGWVGFNFQKAFGCPVKIINDAAMQALGSYEGGQMLFLGLGTGLGSALVSHHGNVIPLELAHLPYKNDLSYEDYVGLAGLRAAGKKEMAETCGRGGGAADGGVAGGIRRARRRQRAVDRKTSAPHATWATMRTPFAAASGFGKNHERRKAAAGGTRRRQGKLAALGALPGRTPMGHGARGLFAGRHGVGLFSARPRPQPRLSLGRGRHRRASATTSSASASRSRLWNGKDPILKERLFGLTNREGNHGEDVKELYYYLDATPTHSYLKMLYKYPQREFPYAQLVEENARRKGDGSQPEFELLDTGIFDDDRYFDVFVEYAKAGPEDILMRVTVHNRGPEAATIHLLPQLWFRNTWSWKPDSARPEIVPARIAAC